mmetsp:Transcript_7641/g.12991  ORF Transcript_7641/g.12991 Transcript_7641/m.12991 type:complete len:86 (+) Transcript_7641:91-348(+)
MTIANPAYTHATLSTSTVMWTRKPLALLSSPPRIAKAACIVETDPVAVAVGRAARRHTTIKPPPSIVAPAHTLNAAAVRQAQPWT